MCLLHELRGNNYQGVRNPQARYSFTLFVSLQFNLGFFLFPQLKEERKKKWMIFVYITVFIVRDCEGVRRENQKKRVGGLRRKNGELMYGWIKLSYPIPPSPRDPSTAHQLQKLAFPLRYAIPHRTALHLDLSTTEVA